VAELDIAHAAPGLAFPRWLPRLTRLRSLRVIASNMTGIMRAADLAPLARLAYLSVEYEPLLEVQLAPALPELPMLVSLDMIRVRIVDGLPVALSPALRSLRLIDNNLSSELRLDGPARALRARPLAQSLPWLRAACRGD
jgi:hypothetical protein